MSWIGGKKSSRDIIIPKFPLYYEKQARMPEEVSPSASRTRRTQKKPSRKV